MQEGAFALIDCLGFKGIWKRKDPVLLLEKLRSILQMINNQIMVGLPFHLLRIRREFIITPSLLSDSVAISLRYADVRTNKRGEEIDNLKREKSYLVWLICASTIKVLDLYLKGEPELVLRGCITYGKWEHDITKTGSFIVGPAVDDAVINMEIAQGAFVWLHPDAEELYKFAVEIQMETIRLLHGRKDKRKLMQESKQSLAEPIIVDAYDMPLKIGNHLRCPVLNPLAFHTTESEREQVFRAYEKAISGNQLDVLLKRQYTMEFLKDAEKALKKHSDWYNGFIDSLEDENLN